MSESTVHTIEILADPEFQNGFMVFGKTHEAGCVGMLYPSEKRSIEPSWEIAQWECSNNIAAGNHVFDEKMYNYRTSSQYVAISQKENDPDLVLELLASKEYITPRQKGQGWPHLLIIQNNLQARVPTLDKVKEINFTLKARIAWCDKMMDTPSQDLHAAQVNLFFVIKNMVTGDFFWFGIPFYDSRITGPAPKYMARDKGKSDASEKFIYTVEQELFAPEGMPIGQWAEYDKDIYPLILDGLRAAQSQGYLSSINPKEYTMTHMNVGWEMPGIYDGRLEIDSIRVTAQITQHP